MSKSDLISTQDVAHYLLSEDNPTKRQAFYKRSTLSLVHLERLKTEVDTFKDQNEARAFLAGQRAYELGQLIATTEACALGNWALAIGLSVKNDYAQAIKHFKEARAGYQELNQPLKAAQVALRQIQAHAMMGELDIALSLGTEIRQLFLSHNCQEELGMVDNNLGILYTSQANYMQAKLSLQSALNAYKALSDHAGMALAYLNLADVYQEEDKLLEARGHLEIAIAIAKVAGQTKTEAGAMVNLALLYRKEGQLSKALNLLTRARDLYEQMASPDKALAQLEEARVLFALNLFEEAENLASEVSRYFEQKQMALENLEALTLLAETQAYTGRVQEALAMLENVERGWLGSGNPLQAAQTRLGILSIQLQQGISPKAIIRELKAIQRQFAPQSLAMTLALMLEARAYLLENDSKKAKEQLSQAKNNALNLGIPQVVMQVLHLFGKAAQQSNSLNDAESYYKEAICYADSIRSSFAVDEFKLAFSNSSFNLYNDLISLLLSQRRTEEAFEYLIKAKSHIFLHLVSDDTDLSQLDNDEVKLRLQNNLNEERNRLESYLGQLTSSPPSETLRQAILQTEQKLNGLGRDFQSLSHKPRLLIPKIPSLAELRAELNSETLLIEFYIAENTLAAFVISPQAIMHVEQIAKLSEIEEDLAWLKFYFDRLALGGKFSAIYGEEKLNEQIKCYLANLYQHCLAKIEKNLSVSPKKLIIVTDGILNALPFSALFDGHSYLLERYQIALFPSSSILCLRNRAKETSRQEVLAFGLAHSDIPHAQHEVEDLRQLFPNAKVFLNSMATLSHWKTYAQQADILHLATHGIFRPDNPMFSRLSFSDGWLTAKDLYRFRLNNALVVLSACESGLTGTQRQNEHLGLLRAFFHAGASSLVTTLWPVKDASTAELIRHFYNELLAGSSVAEALQKAQNILRKSYPNPYYWAAFQVNGNPNWSWN